MLKSTAGVRAILTAGVVVGALLSMSCSGNRGAGGAGGGRGGETLVSGDRAAMGMGRGLVGPDSTYNMMLKNSDRVIDDPLVVAWLSARTSGEREEAERRITGAVIDPVAVTRIRHALESSASPEAKASLIASLKGENERSGWLAEILAEHANSFGEARKALAEMSRRSLPARKAVMVRLAKEVRMEERVFILQQMKEWNRYTPEELEIVMRLYTSSSPGDYVHEAAKEVLLHAIGKGTIVKFWM